MCNQSAAKGTEMLFLLLLLNKKKPIYFYIYFTLTKEKFTVVSS